MFSDLLKRVENEKACVVDACSKHRKRVLAELLDDYSRHLLDKGATSKEAVQTARRCQILFEAVRFVQLKDVDATHAERYLAERRNLAKKNQQPLSESSGGLRELAGEGPTGS